MLCSPLLLEAFALERARSLSRHLARCRVARECAGRSPPRWRPFLARCMAYLSLRLDDSAARAALDAEPSLR